jgi:hypothetical protein
MGQYDAYLICENGHGVNDCFYRHPEFNKKFCGKCGKGTLKACPSCSSDIPGDYQVHGVIAFGSDTPVPDICQECGEDFPWRSKKTALAKAAASEVRDDQLLLNNLLERFHLVAKQLRQRYDDRETLDIRDEYDVQDLLHAMLKLHYDDIRNEEWNPSYAGGSSRSDFLLKSEQIVIEVKKTRATLKAKQLGDQLIVDIARYKTHPNCKILYCFVYDPEGYINNPSGIENDLNDDVSEMKVKVVIVPKGH